MNPAVAPISPRAHERGFTLIEALIAMVILAFGMIAVSNLLIVAASSNTVANQSTAATTTATEALERLKAQPFGLLAAGGDLDNDVAGYFRLDTVPGVGVIHTRWQISSVTPNDNQTLFIRVRSEGTGALSRARSAAEFTTFRSCTAVGSGCPNP